MDRFVGVLRLSLVLVLTVAATAANAVAAQPAPELDTFALPGEDNIMDEAHFGIVHGRATVGIPYRRLAAIDGLWAPPWVSTDFRLSVAIDGKEPSVSRYTWRPHAVERIAAPRGVATRSTTALAPGRRAGVMAVTLRAGGSVAGKTSVTVACGGTLDRSSWWEFAAPRSATATKAMVAAGALRLDGPQGSIVVRGAGLDLAWDAATGRGAATVVIEPGREHTFFVVFAVGPRDDAEADAAALAADPAAVLRSADAAHLAGVRELREKLPRLKASDDALVRFYDRSLVHLLTNRWDVPEFVLRPYYSTGSVRGGCVCNYLWNFGEPWEILPMFDPQADREHICHFLHCDITKHFAFEPTTGKAFGPWYMVNQEKIIGLVYYYVRATGDLAFLERRIDGKTVLQHVAMHALHGDDPATPVALIDYGPSNSHLELRRGYPYNHVMPDLNGRRWANYHKAAELIEQATAHAARSKASLPGPLPTPAVLRQRAADLAVLFKKRCWNRDQRWFDFFDAAGKRDTRWTVQMFKLFNSGALDAETEAGLMSHLNEREFLSAYGLHSLAKGDIAYDPADVDNGGPGSCTCFPPQIAERLYKAGHPQAADDILRRILWWGKRLPYWGDSIVADRIDYRRDTPLQCTLDGSTVAQCTIFGLFGIAPQWEGGVAVGPARSTLAARMELTNVQLRGERFDVSIADGQFEVRTAGAALRAPLGKSILVRDGRLR